jgi:hypothetical protein
MKLKHFLIFCIVMEDTLDAKNSFDSFDADFIKGFDFDGKVEDTLDKCASTQECSDYQKVNFEKIFENQVIIFVFNQCINFPFLKKKF